MKTYVRVFFLSFLSVLPGLCLGAGQVRTADIVDGAVTTAKLAAGAATGSKLGTDVATHAETTPTFTGNLHVGTGSPAQATTAGSFYVTGPGELGGTIWFDALTGPALLWVNSTNQVQMVVLGSGLSFNAGTSTLSSTGSGGTVTSVTASSPLSSSGGATPNITISTVGISEGGTGQTTATTAFNALSPMTTAGDLILGGTSGAGTRLAKGSDSQVLTVDPTTHLPLWATLSSGSTLQQVMTAGHTSTVSSPLILTPAAGTAFQATTADANTAASITAQASAAGLSITQTRGSAGATVVQNTLSISRNGGGSDSNTSALVLINDTTAGAKPLLEMQSSNVDIYSFAKNGTITNSQTLSWSGIGTDGAGNYQRSTQTGTCTITAPATTVAVSFGSTFSAAPVSVQITPTTNPGTTSWWVSGITTTGFTLNETVATTATFCYTATL